MIRAREAVFVDTGAWIGLALSRDPLHNRACEQWQLLHEQSARLFTSIPIILETFTFLERNTRRDVALAWKESLATVPALTTLECRAEDLSFAWDYFTRKDLHKLSAVDATSFVLMKRSKIRVAFAFDHHFSVVGFRMVG